jgi:hypothetical protein
MNDPHVVRLRYRVLTGETTSYDSPPAVAYCDPEFDLKLENGILTADMKEHHATAGSAIERIRPTLRAWEIQAGLAYGQDALKFEFDGAEVIDRLPPPPGSATLHALSGSVSLSITGRATLHAVRKESKRPHTPAEQAWMVEAVKKLIARVAAHEFNPAAPLPQLTLADLPNL